MLGGAFTSPTPTVQRETAQFIVPLFSTVILPFESPSIFTIKMIKNEPINRRYLNF